MDEKIIIELFFKSLKSFLLDNEIESKSNLKGHSLLEIKAYESKYNYKLPYSYKLFLNYFAKESPNFLDCSYCSLGAAEYAIKTANSLLTKNFHLPKNIFVFTEWQGYNYHYFILNSKNNPEVIFNIITSDINPTIKKSSEGKFTDWICNNIAIHLKHKKEMYNEDIEYLLIQLENIRKIID